MSDDQSPGLQEPFGLNQHSLFSQSHTAILVILLARITAQRFVCGTIFRGGVLQGIPTLVLRQLVTLRQSLKQMHADVFHSIRLGSIRIVEPVEPDRLCHVIPPVQRPLWHARFRGNT